MKDILLDPLGHDLTIVNGDLALTGDEAQHIKQRLLTLYQEWFLDLSIGLPWFTDILGKYKDLTQVEILLKSCIQETPGVAALTAFSIEALDTPERTARVAFTVVLDSGVASAIVLEV